MYRLKSTIEPIGGDSIYKIYIDTYFLFNVWMNLWVLFLCRFFIHSKVKTQKVVIVSIVSAIVEVLILCIPYGNSTGKIILGFGGTMALGIYWLFRPKTRKFFGKLLICSYLTMFVLGGAMIFIDSVWRRREISTISWSLIVVMVTFFLEIVFLRISVKSDIYPVVLTISESKECRVIALRDSGNGLEEPISKVPVSIVEEDMIEPYKDDLKEERFRLVPFHSIGKEQGIMEAYFIDKMEIINEGENRVIYNPIIAITKDRISVGRNYQMILHPALLEQGGRNSDL